MFNVFEKRVRGGRGEVFAFTESELGMFPRAVVRAQFAQVVGGGCSGIGMVS